MRASQGVFPVKMCWSSRNEVKIDLAGIVGVCLIDPINEDQLYPT